MVITFYNTADDYRVLDKTLGIATGSARGVLHERVSDVQISVKIHGSLFNVVTQSNYVMVDTFQKYYFLRTYEVENDCVIINLFEDVRMSFSTQIKNVNATVARQENLKNGYLLDERYKAKTYKKIVHKEFPNALDDMSIILMTVG